MPIPDRIAALLAREISTATHALVSGGSVDRWERQMLDAIARGHAAAAIVGTAERLGVEAGSKLLNERNLSRAERQAIKDAVAGQLPYLRKFADDVRSGRLSDAQIVARAALYAGATRATWGAARWASVDLPAMPGDGSTECLTQCGCAWAFRDDGYYWERGKNDSCPTCTSREAQWRPWRAA